MKSPEDHNEQNEVQTKDQGPSIDSHNMDDRIAARRQRIKRRVEQQRRELTGDDSDALGKNAKQDLSMSRKQVKESISRITKLKSDGSNLVDNIKVASDAREAARRREEYDLKKSQREKLESEAKTALEKFEEITKRWQAADLKDVPQELHDLLMQQKSNCDSMVDEKNKIINEFQSELKSKDDRYVKDLKKQAEEIDLMIARMEDQMKNLAKTYREELFQIERAFTNERKDLLASNSSNWEALMNERRSKEDAYLKTRQQRVEENEIILQQLRIKDAEEYNSVKVKMETDVQILEQQLQQMKATYQLNQEKLEYNFQVLKKRDEENQLTMSQQKRKITKLQDVLNNLKIRLAKQEKGTKDESKGLMDDYKKICEQFKNLQKKVKHFHEQDSKIFHEVWLMNEEICQGLAFKLLQADKTITEQLFGMSWECPDITHLENKGPIVIKQEQKSKTATEYIHEVMTAAASSERPHKEEEARKEEEGGLQEQSEDPMNLPIDGFVEEATPMSGPSKETAKTVKKIMDLIGDESGFLVEEKLKTLLKPLEDEEQKLMKLDAIFQALGIETETDITKLSGYFLKYLSPREQQQQGEEGGEDAEVAELTSRSDGPPSGRFIHENDVIRALRAFVQDNKHAEKIQHNSIFKSLQLIQERDSGLDEEYWKALRGTIAPESEKCWKAMAEALAKYNKTLKQRAKLIAETDGIRQQNAELRLLLNQYINSRVNAELEIPPTRVLQLDALSIH